MPLKINFKTILLYAAYLAAFIFSNSAVKGVPLSLGILFAALLCGSSVIATPVLFALSSIVSLNLTVSLTSLFAGLFLGVITFLYRRTGRKIRFEAIAYLIIALAPYVAFAPWLGGEIIISNGYALRGIAAGVIIVFSYFCLKSVYALMFRLQRCRLREDELVCLGVVYAVCGVGM